MATRLTQKYLAVPILLIDIAALTTRYAGILRPDSSKGNTVFFTEHFQPGQPITHVPTADKRTHIFTQAPFEFGSMRDAF